MIQPIRTSPILWTVEWLDLNEPCRSGAGVILPTLLFVFGGRQGKQELYRDMVAELDQRRLERLLGKLFLEHGNPDRLFLAGADEWDPTACEAFARDGNFELIIYEEDEQQLPGVVHLARSTRDALGEPIRLALASEIASCGTERLREMAEGLAAQAAGMRSGRKRLAMLEKAVELDTKSPLALVSLAELEFQRGDATKSLSLHEKALVTQRSPRCPDGDPAWWTEPETRPALRALMGRAVCKWHLGNLTDATQDLELLLARNPRDNQGARFLLPLLYQLAQQQDEAMRFFHAYEKQYERDFYDPGMLFCWGLTLWQADDEIAAAEKYRGAQLRNIYIAPILLDRSEPPEDLWQPHDRAEPGYADEFCYSFGSLWDRDAAARRFLAECHERFAEDLAAITDLRRRMGEMQDQRYEPQHEELWQALVEEEKALLKSTGSRL